MSAVTVAGPPTSVYRELHEVCKTQRSSGSRRCTAWQSAKLLQIDSRRTFRSKIDVQKALMCEFIVGVVVDVLRHVRIEHRKRRDVGWSATSAAVGKL